MERPGEPTGSVLDTMEQRPTRSVFRERALKTVTAIASLGLVAGCTLESSEAQDVPHHVSTSEAPTFAAQPTESVPTLTARPKVKVTPAEKAAVVTAEKKEDAEQAPNIVYILLDDMQMDLLPYMKKTNKLIFDKGAVFDNYFDNQTLCCPARVTILRGQYVHNHHVESNTLPHGGFAKFHNSGEEQETIATAIHHQKDPDGKPLYDTALVGKYLNNFPFNFAHGKHNKYYVPNDYMPPGWTHFVSPVKGDPYTNNNYKLAVDGHVDKHFRRIQNNSKNYLTDTLSNESLDLVRDAAKKNKPFFLYQSFYSPHHPSNPAPRHQNYVIPDGPRPEDDPAFNEKFMTDKPHWMQKLPRISPNVKRQIDENYDQRIRAVQAIDDSVAEMVKTLKETGQYDNTYIVFTSDNGFHEGQHRMAMGKNTPYDTDLHLPAAIVGPGIRHQHIKEMVGNHMWAATFAQLTGAHMPYTPDGRSMVPLLYGKHPEDWPKAVLTERFNSQAYSSTEDGLNEPADTPAEAGKTSTTPYEGIRTKNFLYVVYNYGKRGKPQPKELYDMRTDPYQLHNIMVEGRKMSPYYHQVKLRLGKELTHYATCQGESCQH